MAVLYAYKCMFCGTKEDHWLDEPDERLIGGPCPDDELGHVLVRDWSSIPGTGFIVGGSSKAKFSKQI